MKKTFSIARERFLLCVAVSFIAVLAIVFGIEFLVTKSRDWILRYLWPSRYKKVVARRMENLLKDRQKYPYHQM